MERRYFFNIAGPAAIGMWLLPAPIQEKYDSGKMTAKDLDVFLRSLVEVAEPSVDKIIVGNPDTVIDKIGTAWMPYWNTLKDARKKGVNTMVVHEPTFYTHLDLEAVRGDYLSAPLRAKEEYLKQVAVKQKWIEDNQMVIIRCHDVLDKIKGYGIPFALGRGLGFQDEDIIRSKMYYNVYQIKAKKAKEVAKAIAERLKGVGQPGIAFYGDENYEVKTIGLGTGCISNPINFMEMEPDLQIAIDDSINTWTQTAFSADTGKPLIVINHGTSEEYGMKELSHQLKLSLPQYETIHFNQGCSYKWIT
jgi:putative NIF3 family GTP cyclohydrolase 1 type 2